VPTELRRDVPTWATTVSVAVSMMVTWSREPVQARSTVVSHSTATPT
jgi:hypothetical protein